MKASFYDPSYLQAPEFVNGNHYVHLKEIEQNLLVEHLAKVEEEQKA